MKKIILILSLVLGAVVNSFSQYYYPNLYIIEVNLRPRPDTAILYRGTTNLIGMTSTQGNTFSTYTGSIELQDASGNIPVLFSIALLGVQVLPTYIDSAGQTLKYISLMIPNSTPLGYGKFWSTGDSYNFPVLVVDSTIHPPPTDTTGIISYVPEMKTGQIEFYSMLGQKVSELKEGEIYIRKERDTTGYIRSKKIIFVR